MTAVITVPFGGDTVLGAVADGFSPWNGWDRGVAAKSGEAQDAYEARARAVTECRRHGLLTPENLLTPLGREALKAMGKRLG